MTLARMLVVALAFSCMPAGPAAGAPLLAFTISAMGNPSLGAPVEVLLTVKNVSGQTLHVDPLEVSLFSRFHIVDVATGFETDVIGGVTLDEFEPPHPGSPLPPGASVSIRKQVPAFDEAGTYRITSSATLSLPQAPSIALGVSNSIDITIPKTEPPARERPGAPLDGVAFGIRLSPVPFYFSDPVRIQCTVYNHRRIALVLHEAAWRRCGKPDVRDASGAPLRLRTPGDTSPSWPEYDIAIPPGGSDSSEIDLQHWFIFTDTGPFTVALARTVEASVLTSDALRFNFIEASFDREAWPGPVDPAIVGTWRCERPDGYGPEYVAFGPEGMGTSHIPSEETVRFAFANDGDRLVSRPILGDQFATQMRFTVRGDSMIQVSRYGGNLTCERISGDWKMLEATGGIPDFAVATFIDAGVPADQRPYVRRAMLALPIDQREYVWGFDRSGVFFSNRLRDYAAMASGTSGLFSGKRRAVDPALVGAWTCGDTKLWYRADGTGTSIDRRGIWRFIFATDAGTVIQHDATSVLGRYGARLERFHFDPHGNALKFDDYRYWREGDTWTVPSSAVELGCRRA